MAESEHRWYVVHTQPNAERRAAEHLQRQGFACYLPRYLKQRRHARRVETVSAPFFPRYLFVAVDITTQRWRAINSTVGVSGLVSHGALPSPVPTPVVDALRERENDAGYIELASPASKLRQGDAVRIVDSVFEACRGFVEAVTDKDRVAILLDMLGRKVRVVLDARAVEAV